MTADPALRIGILGCAGIARPFARDLAGCSAARIVAVASRDAAKALAFAAEFGIGRHHRSYERLLADAEVDAVYVPLPNSLHAEWAVRAAEAGKHVLCEKPLAVSLAQAKAMFDAAERSRVMLLEAYPWYFQPQTAAMLELLHGGTVGALRSIQASFGFTLSDPEGRNIRMNPELGGGALLDAGSYPLSLIRLVAGRAPQRVMAHARWAPSGVDIATAATLFFDGGLVAQMSCAMDAATHRQASIVGAAGVIETEYLNHTGPHPFGFLPSRLRVRRGVANTLPFERIESGTGSGFRFAAEAFAKVVAERDGAAIARAARASLDIAAMLDAIAASARSGEAVTIAGPAG